MQIAAYWHRRLVKSHLGTMPVILTCPHDGGEAPQNVRERTSAATPSSCQFNTNRDIGTALITESVAQKILEVSGLSPYVVIARFHRKFIDANRSSNCAFIDPDGQRFYDEYHTRIRGYLKQIRLQNGNQGFLFDIHGTGVISSDPADLYLGTANGASLLPGFDRDTIFYRHGLHGLLKSARHRTGNELLGPTFHYRLSPKNAATQETGVVNGGFTVRNYAASVNCIQIEIADTLRNDSEKRSFLIEDLAFSIINFTRRHAPF